MLGIMVYAHVHQITEFINHRFTLNFVIIFPKICFCVIVSYNFISDCLTHNKKQCFQCNYEKTCDSGQSAQCDTMAIAEYEELVDRETKLLESKCTAAIEDAINHMKDKKAELLEKVKSDPRKSSFKYTRMVLELKINRYNPVLYHFNSPISEYEKNRPLTEYEKNTMYKPINEEAIPLRIHFAVVTGRDLHLAGFDKISDTEHKYRDKNWSGNYNYYPNYHAEPIFQVSFKV